MKATIKNSWSYFTIALALIGILTLYIIMNRPELIPTGMLLWLTFSFLILWINGKI